MFTNPLKYKLVLFVILISVFIILPGLMTALLGFYVPGLTGIFHEEFKPKERRLNGEFGDKFYLSEQLVITFPEQAFNYKIYGLGNEGRYLIAEIDKVEDLEQRLEGIYYTANVRCYFIHDLLIYITDLDTKFKALRFWELEQANQSFLIPCVREIFKKGWDWIPRTVDVLLKFKDQETINYLKRYSKGQFTEEELKRNIGSSYSQEDVSDLANDILIEHGIGLLPPVGAEL